MAIWQYHFYILPAKCVANLADEQLYTIFEEGQYVENFWAESGMLRYAFNEMNSILPAQKSWCATIDQYGNLESNCFEISYNKSRIEDISFRIKFTDNFDDLLASIIEFCDENNLTILGERYTKLPQELESIKAIIFKSSNATTYQKLSTRNNNL